MRAVLMRAFGDEQVLEFTDVDAPEPGPGEALVRVGAVEVSRTRDVATRTGRHPFSRHVRLPHVLGGDFAGVVEAVGPGVEASLVGRRVAASCTQACGDCAACRSGREAQCSDLAMLGIHRWGSYAEFTTVPLASLHEIPDALSMAEAAAMAATGPIALTQLAAGGVGPGSWLLVTGATGALATALLALAPELGARTIGLSRRPSEIPGQLSVDARLDAAREDLTGELLELTGGEGITVAIDNVADAEVFARYLPALAAGGRVVVSGAIGTGELPVLPVPAALLYIRSLSLLGVRTATPREASGFWDLVREGFRLAPGLVHELPLESAAAAHARIASGARVGHTVLAVDP
jgi:NADPH:quinone reductase-like Zn-dependent oxidoreductase